MSRISSVIRLAGCLVGFAGLAVPAAAQSSAVLGRDNAAFARALADEGLDDLAEGMSRVIETQPGLEGTDEGLEVSPLRLEVNGDLAYMVGRYRLPPTEAEDADSGQYVLCLKRQADGAWKLTADIWNGSGETDERGAGEELPGAAIS